MEVINHSEINIKAGNNSYGGLGYYAIEVHTGESKIVDKDGWLFYTYNGINYLLGYKGTETEGWSVSRYGSNTSIASSELANPATAATYLKDTYSRHYWERGKKL